MLSNNDNNINNSSCGGCSSSISSVLELAIHLKKFKNINLSCQGYYSIQVSLDEKEKKFILLTSPNKKNEIGTNEGSIGNSKGINKSADIPKINNAKSSFEVMNKTACSNGNMNKCQSFFLSTNPSSPATTIYPIKKIDKNTSGKLAQLTIPISNGSSSIFCRDSPSTKLASSKKKRRSKNRLNWDMFPATPSNSASAPSSPRSENNRKKKATKKKKNSSKLKKKTTFLDLINSNPSSNRINSTNNDGAQTGKGEDDDDGDGDGDGDSVVEDEDDEEISQKTRDQAEATVFNENTAIAPFFIKYRDQNININEIVRFKIRQDIFKVRAFI